VSQDRTSKPDPAIRPLLLKPDQAISVLGVTRTKLFELLRDGTLASVLVGPRQRRIPYAECERYVASLMAEQNPAA
jgi:excisionase family DNA binding protein